MSAEFSSGSPLSFAFLSVASLEASLAFYRDRIGLTASPIVALPALAAGFEAGGGLPVRAAMCAEPGTVAGRVLLVEYAARDRITVRLPGDRTTRGLWNLNFYVDDIHAVSRELRASGFEFWSDPTTYQVGETAGVATEVVFEAPDGVAVNLVEPQGGPETFTGRVRSEVARHGKTRTGFTPVATSAHCVRDLAAASGFYARILGMQIVLDEYLGRPETNHFLARPATARTHTRFYAGAHFYGKIALNEPQNFAVAERVDRARAPAIGYLAQGFVVPSLQRVETMLAEVPFAGVTSRRVDLTGLPGIDAGDALQLNIPGSGALALLVQER